MKRLRGQDEDANRVKYDYSGLFHLLVSVAGPDDHFVRAFFAQALAHLALAPGRYDYSSPTIAHVALVSRFFARAYREAHTLFVFPELDRRFEAFAARYDAWVPVDDPIEAKARYEKHAYAFTPLQFADGTLDSRPRVAQLSMLHWLAWHRYPRPMDGATKTALGDSLKLTSWNSWLQTRVLKRDPPANVLGRPWPEHDIPTLACAASARSHRCVQHALEALLLAYVGWGEFAEQLKRQREFMLIWIFFGMMASLWNPRVVLHDQWQFFAGELVIMDKLRKDVYPEGGPSLIETVIFSGNGDS